jgi:hypothetical protein
LREQYAVMLAEAMAREGIIHARHGTRILVTWLGWEGSNLTWRGRPIWDDRVDSR